MERGVSGRTGKVTSAGAAGRGTIAVSSSAGVRKVVGLDRPRHLGLDRLRNVLASLSWASRRAAPVPGTALSARSAITVIYRLSTSCQSAGSSAARPMRS